MDSTADTYGTDITLANYADTLPAVSDPIERAFACDNLLAQVPAVQRDIAEIRAEALYAATLRPGWDGNRVAEHFGISPTAVSKAVAERRGEDRTLMRTALTALLETDATALATREVAAAITARDVTAMARRLIAAVRHLRSDRLTPAQRAQVARAAERAAALLDAAEGVHG